MWTLYGHFIFVSGGASSPAGGDNQEPFQDEVEQLLGDGAGGEEEEEGEGEDLFGDNFERCVEEGGRGGGGGGRDEKIKKKGLFMELVWAKAEGGGCHSYVLDCANIGG